MTISDERKANLAFVRCITDWARTDLNRAAPPFLFWSHWMDRLLWYSKGNQRPVLTLVPTWPVTEPPNCRRPECRLHLSQSFQDGEPFSPTGHLLQMADQQLPRHNGRSHRLRVRQVSYCELHSSCTVHVESVLFAGANVRGLSKILLVHWNLILWVTGLLHYDIERFIRSLFVSRMWIHG